MSKISRKKFLKQSLLATGGLSMINFMKPAEAVVWQSEMERIKKITPQKAAKDEAFWKYIRSQYAFDPAIINLNNGAVSPQPKVVQQAHIEKYQRANHAPSYLMWEEINQLRGSMKQRLADMLGCSKKEIAINRNTTEGLNTIIFGLDLQKGDEIVVSPYDYPFMLNAWKQREQRDGIKLNYIDIKLPAEDDEQIVEAYRKAITPKTKIVHVTHLINWTGQIVPAKKITRMAQEKGCEVILDGAHSFAQIDFNVKDIGCDYFATSLHKWLCAPFGTGMMYVKKEKVPKIWPLLSSWEPRSDEMGKFEDLGTRSYPAEMATVNALDFHQEIGQERKTERLRYLKNYWCEKVKDLSRLKLHTSLLPEYSCGLATFSIEGMEAQEIDKYLFENYHLHTGPIDWEDIHGVRVTPNVFTSLEELDLLVKAVREISKG